MSKKEVAKTEDTSKAISTEVNYGTEDWGADNVSNKDMLLPRLALMHGTSKLVIAEKANTGDIVNTATGKVICKKGETLEFIPVRQLPRTWVVSIDGDWEKTEVMKPGEEREWEVETDDGTVKNERCLNYYVLVRSEMKGSTIPYLLAFKGTSFKAGQRLVNHFKLSAGEKKPPARKSFKLTSAKRSNDKNTWLIWDVEEHELISKEELDQAYNWHLQLKALDDNLVTKYDQEAESSGDQAEVVRDVKQGEVSKEADY